MSLGKNSVADETCWIILPCIHRSLCHQSLALCKEISSLQDILIKSGQVLNLFVHFFWWDCIWYECIPLMIHIKPSVTALGQPLWMAPHTSDWGNSLNSSRRRGKRLTIVVMFVVEFYWLLTVLSVLFLPYETYGVGVFIKQTSAYKPGQQWECPFNSCIIMGVMESGEHWGHFLKL